MFTPEGWQPLTFFGTLWTLLFICNAYYANSYSSETTQILVTSALVTTAVIFSMLLALFMHSPRERVFVNWTWSLAGIFYMGWLLSYWVLLMNSPDWAGRDWVLLAIFSTFAVDTTAYFVGRAFGRHKLAPTISPGKTWEGAFGGMLGGIAAVIILALALDISMAYGKLVLIGFLIGLFAQIGDLERRHRRLRVAN